MTEDPADRKFLRAKYLDWCSARVAEHFLALTPDQIYQLAHAWEQGDTGRRAPLSVSPPDEDPGAREPRTRDWATVGEPRDVYRGLVQRVTEVLRLEMKLPGYDAWVAEYRACPERFDADLLGFWRAREVEGAPDRS